MYPLLEKFLTDLPKIEPATYAATYPKRITPPHGYLNPRYYTATLWSQLRIGCIEPNLHHLAHVVGIVNALTHLHYRVPTYFVRSEFAQAVAQTEPPADFRFEEIKWPMPAMLFVLPTQFSLHYFGYHCPFLSLVRGEQGTYPDMFTSLPPCDLPLKAITPVTNTVPRINISYPVYTPNGLPMDYAGSYPLHMRLQDMEGAPFDDATLSEKAFLPEDHELVVGTAGLPEGDAERALNNKMQAFAVKLLLALTARPNYITQDTCARPQRIKRGKVVKDELWHPNLVGWSYTVQRDFSGASPSGTHQSPRMHWRRGHMRNQPYGPKPWTDATPKRLTWIEPVLINAPETKA